MTNYASQLQSAMSNWGQPNGAPGFSSFGTPYAPGGDVPQLGGMNNFGANPMSNFGADVGNFQDPYKSGGIMDSFLSKNGQQGWGSMALGGAGTLASVFMGMKQYGAAERQLAENRRQFDTNFGAQQKLTNGRLEDRQRARVASNAGAYESVGTYMKQNGVG